MKYVPKYKPFLNVLNNNGYQLPNAMQEVIELLQAAMDTLETANEKEVQTWEPVARQFDLGLSAWLTKEIIQRKLELPIDKEKAKILQLRAKAIRLRNQSA